MKTAISIEDKIFQRAEHYARRKKKSRSELYAEAISEYLARHDADAVTEAMNAVLGKVSGETVPPFIHEAGRRILGREEW